MLINGGPQGEPIERELVRSTGPTIGDFKIMRKMTDAECLRYALSLSPEKYAALIWSKGGYAVKQALLEAGYKDADAPGGRLCPTMPGLYAAKE
jgi:hypothetical protein